MSARPNRGMTRQAASGWTQAATKRPTTTSGSWCCIDRQLSKKVTIAARGFSTQETPDVRVSVNEVARVNAQLKVAAASQNVTVTTKAPLLQN